MSWFSWCTGGILKVVQYSITKAPHLAVSLMSGIGSNLTEFIWSEESYWKRTGTFFKNSTKDIINVVVDGFTDVCIEPFDKWPKVAWSMRAAKAAMFSYML